MEYGVFRVLSHGRRVYTAWCRSAALASPHPSDAGEQKVTQYEHAKECQDPGHCLDQPRGDGNRNDDQEQDQQ